MKVALIAFCLAAACLALVPGATRSVCAASAENVREGTSRHQDLAQRLKELQDALSAKEAELARLRHRWVVLKGRTPSAEEIKEFEKKRAKGEAKAEDNPYSNKSPLGAPGSARVAYYAKLSEIRKDKEAIARLQQELAALKP
jgi:Tfp pilus assembly protein FimV